MLDEQVLSDKELVARARTGDQEAWELIVRRYQPLINGIGRRHRLDDADAADVGQQVWIRLIEYADKLHTPAALPGWIATTATRACLKVVNHRRRHVVVNLAEGRVLDRQATGSVSGSSNISDEVADKLLRAEQCMAVRRGLAELTGRQRELLLLLVADPPVPYRQISRQTGMPLGSIGPTRARLLKRLRDTSALRRLTEPHAAAASCVA